MTALDRVTNRQGMELGVERLGAGRPVVLCHGFPQTSYAWRHVAPQLAAAGHEVIVPDLRGYGRSAVPSGVEDYTQAAICADLIDILDHLGHQDATFVGHDMGGSTVWHLAACHPERVHALCSLGTPYGIAGRAPLTELWRVDAGVFDYQLYLQETGVAEAELEENVAESLNLLVRAAGDGVGALDRYADVRERGGMLAGLPRGQPRSSILSRDDLAVYTTAFERTGFGGAVHWYRHHETTWQWLLDNARHPIEHPALLVIAELDPVLTEELSAGLELVVPRLRRARLRRGHYLPEEAPDEVAQLLVDWLEEVA